MRFAICLSVLDCWSSHYYFEFRNLAMNRFVLISLMRVDMESAHAAMRV